jgi:PPOX class probable F420-dependent enzyme
MASDSWTYPFLRQSRLAHLATSSKDGTPHVVPICFAFDGKMFYVSIDEKPKRAEPKNLRRVLNISENPKVSIVVDSYMEDWRKLRYIIVQGLAKIIHRGREHKRAASLLRRKYRQYLLMNIEKRPMVKIKPIRLVAWRSSTQASKEKAAQRPSLQGWLQEFSVNRTR